MSFGRQRNMTRRASRPDENFHRDRRRKSAGRAVMLDAGGRRPSLFKRILAKLGLIRLR